jgi:filamentous hemagglutinin
MKKGNMTESAAKTEAARRASEIRKGLNALHDPDMVMGGYNSPAPTKMGMASVNKSIGATWRQHLVHVDNYVKQAIEQGHGSSYLNFQLTIRTGSGG